LRYYFQSLDETIENTRRDLNVRLIQKKVYEEVGKEGTALEEKKVEEIFNEKYYEDCDDAK